MRERDLDELFADFEARVMHTFRPPGVLDAQRRLRQRRRRWRGLLAGMVALLLVGPAGAYALAGRNTDRITPDPTPSPTTSASPVPELVERTVSLPGAPGELNQLSFSDARHGWALFDTCSRRDAMTGGCERALGRTTDGGATWREVALPSAVAEPRTVERFVLLPVDDERLTILVEDGYLITTDGGASFSEHPRDNPPPAAEAALATRSGFLIRCADGDLLETQLCPQRLALFAAGGLAAAQPPVDLSWTGHQLIEGGDGRLWLAIHKDDRLTVVVSGDKAMTWRNLPPAPREARRLLVSPDGEDVWLVNVDPHQPTLDTGPKRVWRLAGGTWQEGSGLPGDTFSVAAVNDGLLLATRTNGGGGYVRAGRYEPVPELDRPIWTSRKDAPTVEVLADDTIVLTSPTVEIIGAGSPRTWTRLVP